LQAFISLLFLADPARFLAENNGSAPVAGCPCSPGFIWGER
jgi:hypothetical protein